MSTDVRPSRVVHVVTHLDYGGVESHMAMIGESQSGCVYHHSFCAIGQGGRVAARLAATGAEVACLQARTRIPSWSAIWRLYRLFRRNRPRVVHTHGAEANFHGLIAAALAGVPVRIGEEIGIPTHGRTTQFYFTMAYRCAHRVIGVSQIVTDWLVGIGEVRAGQGVTLANPVSLPDGRGEFLPPADPFRACFVGRLESVKNLVALVDAFGELVAGGAHAELWLVGDGSLRPELEQMVSQRSLQAAVKFHGYQGVPAQWIRQCHVCIQPSISEGFGLAMVEAMGCEVPVISTKVGVAPEIITNGVSGWLVDGLDASGIHAALDTAYRTPRATLVEMGRAARITVATIFEPSVYTKRLEALYDATMQTRSFQ